MVANKGSKLSEAQRAFLVQRLACFDSPKEAAGALNDEHGMQITPQAAERYDPTKRAGAHLPQRLRSLFEVTRKHFLEHLEQIPEANKAVRVRHLAHAARALKANRNYPGMANMLKQIAEEVGNVYTNRRELSGRDGRPIEFADMTEEQLDARIAALLRAMAIDESQHESDGDRRPNVIKH